MTRDLRIGRHHWRGCFSFSNIICDGEPAEELVSREGGLKMGGKYWYYVRTIGHQRLLGVLIRGQYQLDSEMDHHNPCEPSTTSCPYLPGQRVNVLEVPTQDESDDSTGRPSTSSSSIDAKFTLNPEDKFLALKPPKLPRHAQTTLTIAEAQHSSPGDCICLPPQVQDDIRPLKVPIGLPASPIPPVNSASYGRKSSPTSAPISRHPSLWNLFRRNTKSADEVKTETQQAWLAHGILQSPSQNDMGNTCDTANAAGSPHEPCERSTWSPIGRQQSRHDSEDLPFEFPQRRMLEACMSPERLPVENADLPDEERAAPRESMSTLHDQLDRLAIQPIDYTGDVQLQGRKERLPSPPFPSHSHALSLQNFLSLEVTPVKSPLIECLESEVQGSFQVAASDTSYASSHGLSPTWSSTAFTENFSPGHSAGAASPTISDFGEYLTEFKAATSYSTDPFTSPRQPTARYGSGIFDQTEASESNVYQLPEADSSVLTLRDLSQAKDHSGLSKRFDAKNGNNLVEAWNDGSREGVKTTFEEFFDDHSYLSTVIL